MTTTQKVRTLETEEEKERLGSWLAEKAPKDIGADRRSIERTKKLVAKIIEWYPAASLKDIYYCLDNWWVLRCEPGLPAELLKKLLREEFDAAVLERRHKPRDFRQRLRLEHAAKQRRTERRKENAALLKRVADTLGCSTRYARMLISEGTTSRTVAATLARMLGTDPEDHLRSRRRTGREADLVSWFMKVWVPDGSFRDFVETDPKLPASACELVKTLREQKGSSQAEQLEIASLEKLISYCESIRPDSPVAGVAAQVWYAYRVWKIEVVAAHAARTARIEQRQATHGIQGA
jgi:hypothetical protein